MHQQALKNRDLTAQRDAEAAHAGVETDSTISTLTNRGGQISTVADLMREIANRTNLLALNTTIEAAG